jgi:L-threonylcarbamoyladenylate synthase
VSRVVPADAQSVARAAAALRAGELVGFPTETVYGLGADAANPAAVRRIFEAKGRPADHPVIVHVRDLAAARAWVGSMPRAAQQLARKFWPGPLTLILPRAAHVSDIVTGGQGSVGLRVPSHRVAQALLVAFGGGIAAPSANRFGHVSPTRASHVDDDLGERVALILDGGACDFGIESTIVAFRDDAPVLLRPGAISARALTQVLGCVPQGADENAPRASGTLDSHYAPRTPANLVSVDGLRAELAQLLERDEQVAVLARGAPPPADFDGLWLRAPAELAAYAHDLYANLRRLDAAGADIILIEDVPATMEWMAVRDRLTRATHGATDDLD